MAYTLNLATGGLLGITNTAVQNITASDTLSVTQGNNAVAIRIAVVRGDGAFTLTLPASADVEEGQTIRIKNYGTSANMVSPDGTDTIDNINTTRSNVDDIDIVYEGSGNWVTFEY